MRPKTVEEVCIFQPKSNATPASARMRMESRQPEAMAKSSPVLGWSLYLSIPYSVGSSAAATRMRRPAGHPTAKWMGLCQKMFLSVLRRWGCRFKILMTATSSRWTTAVESGLHSISATCQTPLSARSSHGIPTGREIFIISLSLHQDIECLPRPTVDRKLTGIEMWNRHLDLLFDQPAKIGLWILSHGSITRMDFRQEVPI